MTDKPQAYQVRLTPEAERDLEAIWRFSAATWSLKQADFYTETLGMALDRLAHSPFIARERTEFSPPVRVHLHRSHVVIYRVLEGYVDVIRIVHMRQNWSSLLEV